MEYKKLIEQFVFEATTGIRDYPDMDYFFIQEWIAKFNAALSIEDEEES